MFTVNVPSAFVIATREAFAESAIAPAGIFSPFASTTVSPSDVSSSVPITAGTALSAPRAPAFVTLTPTTA